MKKVGIVMGSDSDLPIIKKATAVLDDLGIPYTVNIYSAHRTSEQARDFSMNARANGYGAIIAAAGMAAALPGVVASQTIIPVIGLPISGSVLDGMDALYSIVQMPSGIPVATVAINGSKNAAYLALQIIAINNKDVRDKLLKDRLENAEKVLEANEEVITKY